jgi:glutamine synthetase
MALGLEQEFFVIKKHILNERLDLKTTGRTLIGKVPPKNQQFSDHYYGKLPCKIEQIFKEIEDELL